MQNVLLLDVRIDKAIRFLAEHLPPSDETSRKPILPHNIRVGIYLRKHAKSRKYSDELVLAGFLHDVLEWSRANEQNLQKEFGDGITKLVRANTKDDSIKDPFSKTLELIKRCASTGRDALTVKAADILDSYEFYTDMQNSRELEYCKRNAVEILNQKKEQGWDDPIFQELSSWKEKSEGQLPEIR